jgi:hypothetical protein
MLNKLPQLIAELNATPHKQTRNRQDAAQRIKDCCREIAETAGNETIGHVLALIQPHMLDPDEEVRSWLDGAVEAFGPPAVPLLIDASRDATGTLRRRLVEVFATC